MSRSSRKRKRAERRRRKAKKAARRERKIVADHQQRELEEFGFYINSMLVELLRPRVKVCCP